MKKEEIFLDNIKCGGCGNSIKSALNKMEGITSAEVFPDEDKILIEYDSDNSKAEALKKLAGMGYPEQGTSTLVQKGKSYVSCAIGRVK